ncbi:MAG: phospho-N-acetylmuramoyl-pentapeptide-transferase [Candidatus Caenarcaniphilales bacterium]|jgi:phospho-N-acetylmuramoyl-pentapeptide-transferase|nr:phospho-N-acetylmuramoyl-pentapeptide-transferase [Candidatus Caenarcaniphilales bacterium]
MIYYLPIVLCFLVALALGVPTIAILRKLKSIQSFRALGPESHLKSKSGTPTMGGWIFLIPILGVFAWYQHMFQSTLIILVIVAFAVGAIIGLIDDGLKILQSNYKGLSSLQKLIIQFITSTAIVLISGRYEFAAISSNFDNLQNLTPLWIFIEVIWAFFVIAGTCNAINLTDGLDGLASSLSICAFAGLAFMYYMRDDLSSMLLSLTVIAALAAFLFFNWKPAKVFMGDTGSLSLGMGLGALAYLTNMEWYLAIFALVPVLETLSVMIQIASAKLSRKFLNKDIRPFKMAPLHHHFELIGHSEIRVVLMFTLCQLIISGIFIWINFFTLTNTPNAL